MRHTAIATITLMAFAVGAWAGEDPPRLSFALEDQFGATHTDKDCGNAVVILLGGDRKGSAYIGDWGPALHRALARDLEDGKVCSVGFAHLKGVPFFIKKNVVEGFPKDPEAWTLLDWKGHFAKTWGAEKDSANLYLFDRNGRLVHRASLHDYDQKVFDGIVEASQAAVAGR